jgi:hypothetical protein
VRLLQLREACQKPAQGLLGLRRCLLLLLWVKEMPCRSLASGLQLDCWSAVLSGRAVAAGLGGRCHLGALLSWRQTPGARAAAA